MAAVVVDFPGNLASVASITDLRALPSTNFEDGDLYEVRGVGFYSFDVDSTLADDGETALRPDDLTPLQAGRWLFGPRGRVGTSNNTRETLAQLKAASVGDQTSLYDGSLWTWTLGDFTGKADDTNIVKASSTPLTVGAWVRQLAAGAVTTAPVAAPVARTVQAKLEEMPVSPEDKGGVQAALNAVETKAAAGQGTHGTVKLRQFARYTLGTTLTMNTVRTSLVGEATLDAASVPTATPALRITSTADSEFGNSYGLKGELGGLRLKGAGETGGQIGVEFNAQTANGSAQIDGNGIVVQGFGTGLKFTERAYNSSFWRPEVLNCGTCAFWPAGGTDNGERNTFISPTFYNSGIGFENNEPSAAFYCYGGSIDYTEQIAKVNGGKVFLTDTHQESNRWGLRPIEASGDGGFVAIKGGFLLNTATAQPTSYLAYVGAGARVDIDGAFIHELKLTPETPDTPTAFFNGVGPGFVRNTHGFDGGTLPDRLHATLTCLLDPSFEAATWQDMVWVFEDTATVTNRQDGANIDLGKATGGIRSGTKALTVTKAGGAGTAASAAVLWLPVRYGDKVMAGFHFRNQAGSGTFDFTVQWLWGRLDRLDANGLPVWFGLADALGGFNGGLGEAYSATQSYQKAVFGKEAGSETNRIGLGARMAPAWATHFIGVVRMFAAPAGTLLVDDAWADRW